MTMTQHRFNAFNHPFWRFSLAFYEISQVQELCLALQDESGLDVNRLLYACWLGGQGCRQLPDHPLWTRIRSWQLEVIQPLRQLRRSLPREKEADRRVRRMIQETELKAEQCEQWWLFLARSEVSTTETDPTPLLTWRNLQDVAREAESQNEILSRRLRELVALNHPGLDPEELLRLCAD